MEYPGRDLNPHASNRHWILSPTCLPIPPPGRTSMWSERRDSNPRPRPWQGRALPAELLSQVKELFIKAVANILYLQINTNP